MILVPIITGTWLGLLISGGEIYYPHYVESPSYTVTHIAILTEEKLN